MLCDTVLMLKAIRIEVGWLMGCSIPGGVEQAHVHSAADDVMLSEIV